MKYRHFLEDSLSTFFTCLLGLALFFGVWATDAQAQDWRTRMGLDLLEQQLGEAMPDGTGISVTISDAGRINPSLFPDKNIILHPLNTTDFRSHPPAVLNGLLSVAPGVDNIHSYDGADFWKGVDRGDINPILTDTVNMSLIVSESGGFVNNYIPALDHAFHRDNVFFTSAVGNDRGVTPPSAFASIYNGLSVGRHNGSHHYGIPINQNPDDRYKPDIVATEPISAGSSISSPATNGVATMMIEHARKIKTERPNHEAADRIEVIRSIILTGAVKLDEYNWNRQVDSNDNLISPLDNVYGVGHVNAYRSYNILDTGIQAASDTADVTATGWDYNLSNTTADGQMYYFQINPGTDDFTATLTWDRLIDLNGSNEVVADLDVALYEVTDNVLGQLVQTSNTPGRNNLEHIFVDDIAPGRYALQVISDTDDMAYGLSWWSGRTIPSAIYGDINLDGVIDDGDVQIFVANWLHDINGDYYQRYTHGDLSDDGLVDSDDWALLRNAYHAVNGQAPSFANNIQVPEPTAMAIIGLGLVGLLRKTKFSS